MSDKQKFLNYLLSFGSIVLLNYLDLITTLIGLANGLREVNGFIATVLRNYGIGGFILVKVVAMFVLFFCVSKYKFNFVIIYVLYSFVVLNNVYLSYKPPVGYSALLCILLIGSFMFILKNNTFFGKNKSRYVDSSPIYTCNICGGVRSHFPIVPDLRRVYGIPVVYQKASDKELCVICYRESIEIEGDVPKNDSSTLVHQINSSKNTNAIFWKEELLNG